MTVIATKHQIGTQATPTDNFVWERDASGLAILRRGTHDVVGSTLIKVNADGGVNDNRAVFSTYRTSTAQSISANAYIKAQLNGESFDTAGFFNSTGSPVTMNGLSVPAYAFMPNVAGYYFFKFCPLIDGLTGTTEAIASIYKNGGEALWGKQDGSTRVTPTALGELYLNGTTDYVEAYVYVSLAANLSPSPTRTTFSGHLVRAA